MSNAFSLSRQAKSLCERLFEIYQLADASPSVSPKLLPLLLKELGIISEALQVSIKELEQQNNRIAILQGEAEAQHQRYLNLFGSIPDGCFITNSEFVIEDVNQAGAALINLSIQELIGHPLPDFIFSQDLPLFQAKLTQLTYQHWTELSLRFQRHPNTFFNASVTVSLSPDRKGEPALLQWLLQDVTEQKRAEAGLEVSDYNPCDDRPLFCFNRGETIPLEPHTVWFIADGVAKLTTLSERGEDLLIGIVCESMIFGPTLTALPTYQAIALSDVKLALLPLSEIARSPKLTQVFSSSLKQRLQQTENFLAIYGHMRVEERLNTLLLMLKQLIGNPVEQGTRLRVRLTHQDFASACCTTRVTITRLLGKLQEQGKITQDSHNHLILKEQFSN